MDIGSIVRTSFNHLAIVRRIQDDVAVVWTGEAEIECRAGQLTLLRGPGLGEQRFARRVRITTEREQDRRESGVLRERKRRRVYLSSALLEAAGQPVRLSPRGHSRTEVRLWPAPEGVGVTLVNEDHGARFRLTEEHRQAFEHLPDGYYFARVATGASSGARVIVFSVADWFREEALYSSSRGARG